MSNTNTILNTKTLLAGIFDQMGKLSRGEISSADACAYAKLASQATNVLNYDLKRSFLEMKMANEKQLSNSETKFLE